MISGKSLDKGLVPLMSEEDVVNLLNYVPRYREIEVYIKVSVSSVESHMLESGFRQGHIGDTVMDMCSQAKFMQDGIHNARVSRGEEADKYPCMELNQDLFQQDNVVDAQDYIDMVDELQQGNEDVVVKREEQVKEDTQEAKTVDEIDASDESKFEQDEIPLIKPYVEMNDFHFEVDAHVTNLAGNMVEDYDMNYIYFDEFDSGKDIVAAKIVNKRKKRGSMQMMMAGQSKQNDKMTRLEHKRCRLREQRYRERKKEWTLYEECEEQQVQESTLSKGIGRIFKDLLWKCTTASTVVQSNRVMEEIKLVDPKAHDWLQKIPPSSWSRRWEVIGMPCKHDVAKMFNMASHGKEVGIPEDWVDEIAEQALKKLVKGSKMLRKGTIIYGSKCGEKRHNRRGSTGPRDIIVNGKKKKGNGSRKEGVLDEVLGITSQPVGSQQLRYQDAQVIQQSQGYAGNAGNNQASGARVINTFRNSWANQPRLEETDECEDLQLQATENFKADHVDAYDADCDDEATTNAIFMANLSPIGTLNDDTVEPHYDFDIHSEIPYYDTYHDSDMLNSNIQKLGYIENIVSNNESYDKLKGNINVISYTDYMLTTGNVKDNYVPPPVQKNDMMLSVIKQMKS
nr:hypothetical protein [Tanacetum cinerariifolium]